MLSIACVGRASHLAVCVSCYDSKAGSCLDEPQCIRGRIPRAQLDGSGVCWWISLLSGAVRVVVCYFVRLSGVYAVHARVAFPVVWVCVCVCPGFAWLCVPPGLQVVLQP